MPGDTPTPSNMPVTTRMTAPLRITPLMIGRVAATCASTSPRRSSTVSERSESRVHAWAGPGAAHAVRERSDRESCSRLEGPMCGVLFIRFPVACWIDHSPGYVNARHRRAGITQEQPWPAGCVGAHVECRVSALLLDECPLEHVLPRHTDARRRAEAAVVEDGTEVGKHLRAAAEHGAVVFGIQRRNAEVLGHAPAVQQFGEAPALVAPGEIEALARHRRVIQQLRRDLPAEEFVVRQFVDDVV